MNLKNLILIKLNNIFKLCIDKKNFKILNLFRLILAVTPPLTLKIFIFFIFYGKIINMQLMLQFLILSNFILFTLLNYHYN